MKILILGSDGFIGYHLTSSILQDSRFEDVSIVGVDLYKTRTNMIPNDSRFTFHQGDIIKDRDLVDKLINECDVVLPFVAIATPKLYVEKPLTVFELDFEENLRIIKLAHKLDKRVIFPSTSEVYGKGEIPFDEEKTDLVYGPIKYSRWIYACSKQLLDRVIFAMNQKDKFRFTLFRPFNWEGPYLDSLQASESGSSRLITQLIDDAIYKNHVTLVDGGNQKRCFTDVRDGVEALKLILLNEEKSNGQIFNVGNPLNNLSVKEVATQLVDKLKQRNLTTEVAEIRVQPSSEFYGEGYEDVSTRVPSIENLRNTLGWNPMYSFEESLETILDTIVIQK
jgi:UDP-4-amino-4-deoxy-L-arabinose formyltransferase/UDP-glucuronic acid dehydrogenase (UDP-4-keto-hexauronic acid decarboxylating)